ncbi:DUF1501 domain-containing protein [Stratiformator vulcanicus]|uniref:Sulfatase n=1 Tax=Stratiformator vulcanicus TaxID=2527980 RepID=A0A517QXU6_9PLAN|nr:DUF1501 domain-containing protein [Stratiformator vulcanicus]QDT36476.1 hypothetical protein Pan189_08330 [Stratiformator vulcanicus]
MNIPQLLPSQLGRREFLRGGGLGVGSMALASLLGRAAQAGTSPRPHFAPRAKNIIYLHMVGAPSQLDLFDHKPALNEHHGKLCPKEFIEGKRFAFIKGHPKLLGSEFEFAPRGESGQMMSEIQPHLAEVADELAVIRSVHTEEFNHGPAQVFLMSGFGRQGRPSLGSWVTYGLGSENDDLPAFVVLKNGKAPGGGSSLWGQGFLPSRYQGVEFRTRGEPILFVSDPQGLSRQTRSDMIGDISALNRLQYDSLGDPEILTRIDSYELAFRMQTSVPDLMDIADESRETLDLYGAKPGAGSFANSCLLARRLVERGVRFIQLCDNAGSWDHHQAVANNLRKKCRQTDQPIAALIKDLRQRGLLEDTLIVWGAEFGRTPMLQGDKLKGAGRDHHKDAYTVWMAGGGVKGGVSYGRTDDLGYSIAENPVHINDLHATILHLLGLDHEDLTYRFQGRDFRLTDVAGRVIHDVIA